MYIRKKHLTDKEKERLGVLFKKHHKQIHAYMLGYLHNEDDAWDLTQDTFYEFGNKETNEGEELFALLRIASNLACNRLKRDKLCKTMSLLNRFTAYPSVYSSEYAEEKRTLRRSISRLPKDQGEIILLRYYSACSVEQISKILHISQVAVRARLYRARKSLKHLVQLTAGSQEL